MEEVVWYKDLDWSMIWVCVAAVAVLSLFIAINPNPSDKASKNTISGVGNYFTNTWKNHTYNFLAGIVMLSFVTEVGFPFINSLIHLDAEVASGALHFLAAMSGLGGGFVLAKIIRLFQKLN